MDQAAKSFGMGAMVLRYLVVMVIVMIAVGITFYLIEKFTGHSPGGGMGIISALVPALDAGSVFVRRLGRMPGRREAWLRSFVMMAANLGFGLLAVLLFSAIADLTNPIPEMIEVIGGGALVAIAAVLLVVYLLATRFFFGMGAKSELRRAAREAQKRQ